MPPRNPSSLVRRVLDLLGRDTGNVQEAFNRVQLEDITGADLGTPGNPVHVDAGPVGGMNVHIESGEHDIGHVYGKFQPVSFEFTRPANTTAYTAHDLVGIDLAVTDASNASPIVITTGAVNHLLNDGDYVTISGVTGNTNANGSYYVKRTGYSATTFALYTDKVLATPRAGNAGYINGGDVARLFRLPNFFRVDGGSALLNKVRMLTDKKDFVDTFRVFFYSSPVAANLDNVSLPIAYANRSYRLGYVDLEAFHTEDPANSTAAYSCSDNGNPSASNFPLEVHNAETPIAKDLWCQIVTLGTGTPASGQNFFLEATGDEN